MSKQPSNPPAFPFTTASDDLHIGMSLRDWFAGQALVGLASKSRYNSPPGFARAAYAIADAMLAERERGQ